MPDRAHVTFTVSRVARGLSLQSLLACGTARTLSYRLAREGARWYRGELAATSGGTLAPVRMATGLPRAAGEGDAVEVIGKPTIAPLVKRFLAGIRRGESLSPSFEDGARSQEVLDAVLESVARATWVSLTP